MIDPRLHLAITGEGIDLGGEGLVAVFNPPDDADLAGLDPERCHIIHDFKPSFDGWAARGYEVMHSPTARYDATIVCLPRAKADARAMVALACTMSDGIVVIDGQKTDGIDSMLKAMRGRVTVEGPISKAHGKLFWINAPAAECFADWEAGPALTDGGFWTAPGVFSADGIDLASSLLVETLPERMKGTVVDLGAGWGYLAAHVLTRADVDAVHLVEAGHMALACARHNVTDARAEFHWEDATTWTPSHRVDTVVMNPPFHRGRAAEPQIGQAFVASAARILTSQGDLWMVANRHLPYEAELKKRFAEVEEIGGDARFKLFYARRPLRPRR